VRHCAAGRDADRPVLVGVGVTSRSNNGCAHRGVLDVVGGMHLAFGKHGAEHGDWSQRIYEAALTRFPFAMSPHPPSNASTRHRPTSPRHRWASASSGATSTAPPCPLTRDASRAAGPLRGGGLRDRTSPGCARTDPSKNPDYDQVPRGPAPAGAARRGGGHVLGRPAGRC